MKLAWLSLALCIGGFLPFVWFVAHADWGQGGELQGVGLVIGGLIWATVWGVSSILGLLLSAVVWRRFRSFGLARLAFALNALSLGSFLVFIVLNYVRAAALQPRW